MHYLLQISLSSLFALFLCIGAVPLVATTIQLSKQTSESLMEEYDLIIITPNELKDAFQPLKAHKDNNDIQTVLVDLHEIYSGKYFSATGRDDAEQIKYFIKNAIEHWNTQYVMLVGGKEQMPVRYVRIYFNTLQSNRIAVNPANLLPYTIGESGFISDLYYADIYDENNSFCSWDSNNNGVYAEMNATTIIDSVDLYPDICIGRVLCQNQSETQSLVQKIITYENQAYGKEWFDKIIIAGGDEHANIFLENFLHIGFESFGRTAWEGEYIGNTVAQYLPRFEAQKYYASGTFIPGADPLTCENLNTAINNGSGFLLLSGHGTPTKISTHPPYQKDVWIPEPSGYTISELQTLQNAEKLPVAVLCACSTGNFDAIQTPFAWELVKNPDGGSIATYAVTVQANVQPSTLCTKTLLGHLTVGVFKTYAEKTDIAGEIWKTTIENYLNDDEALELGAPDIQIGPLIIKAEAIWANHLNVEQWELFGDPSLKIGGYPS